MKLNIKTYEEQVLELGNGKMLDPGCYDEKMNWICDVKCLLERWTFPEGTNENTIHHVIMPENATKIEGCLLIAKNWNPLFYQISLKKLEAVHFLFAVN